MKNISLLAIFAGVMVSQLTAFTVAQLIAVAIMFIYSSQFLVAFFEYPGPIAITMLGHLCSVALGGYVAMLVNNRSLINPLIVGLLNLALGFLCLYLIDFAYAEDYLWLPALAGLLTPPAALVFAYNNRGTS